MPPRGMSNFLWVNRKSGKTVGSFSAFRNMKGCIFEANFEGQECSSRLFTVLLIVTWELRYPQNRRFNRKRGKTFGS